MAIASIHDWLNAQGSFALGITLLKLHSDPSRSDLFLFSLGESSVSRERLTELLRAINEHQLVAHNQKLSSQTAAAGVHKNHTDTRAFERTLSSVPHTDIPVEILPIELRGLRKQLTKWHSEITLLRGLMMRTPDGMELRELCLEITALDKQAANGWRKIEYWRDTGNTIPVFQSKEQQTKLADAIKLRAALRVWFSQRQPNAKKPRKFTSAQWEAKEQELILAEKVINDAV